MFSLDTIEQIKEQTDIVELISEDVNLRQSGNSFKALSPFTQEKTPSFIVSPQKGIFKCFSSGKGGNAFTYMMEMHGMSFPEAVRHLAQRVGITLDEREEKKEESDLKERAKEALDILSLYYHENLYKSPSAMRYLNDRGITDEDITEFRIGYCVPHKSQDFLKSKGFTEEEILATGNFAERKGGEYYDRFYGRVIFPIRDVLGKVIAFGGRRLDNNTKSAKYINSPETEIYNKSSVLFGLDLAKDAVRKLNSVIITEGYTDVIAMHRNGFKNTVSTSGTAFTPKMAKTLSRYTDKACLLFDTDSAGENATKKAIPVCLQNGINPRIRKFKLEGDPDQILSNENGRDSMMNLISDTLSATEYLFIKDELSGRLDDSVEKAKAIRECIELVTSGMTDELYRDTHIKEISRLYSVSLKAVDKSTPKIETVETLSQPETQTMWGAEKRLLQAILTDYSVLDYVEETHNFTAESFFSNEAANLMDFITECDRSDTPYESLQRSDYCPDKYKALATTLHIETIEKPTTQKIDGWILKIAENLENKERRKLRSLIPSTTKEERQSLTDRIEQSRNRSRKIKAEKKALERR
ncbi:MAG: hypothetical protein Kapaf2KO_22770 [Candidatus Kapaibacteriales bacterium]